MAGIAERTKKDAWIIIDHLIKLDWAELDSKENTAHLKDSSVSESTFPEHECFFDVLEFISGIKEHYQV